MSFWDGISIGDVFEIGSHVFTGEEIKRFAAKFDPQPFHIDEEAAKNSLLGGICASGWHTAAVSMRLNVDFQRQMMEAFVAAGNTLPKSGPSPGIKNLRWPKPVYAGDTVAFTQTVMAKRVSASRPGWGVMEFSTLGLNQHSETVFAFEAAVFLGTN
ncbi:MAG: MaoC family dehydratase [Rhizobiaceae bacterium]|nr:MaoC family dehydratase [Rhizobiaceae bacterium]